MKANLDPHLGGTFFLRYCGPIALVDAISSWRGICAKTRRPPHRPRDDGRPRRQRRRRAIPAGSRHGEVLTPVELVEAHRRISSGKAPEIVERLQAGTSLGRALVARRTVRWKRAELLLGHYVSEELAAVARSPLRLDAAGRRRGGDAGGAVGGRYARRHRRRRGAGRS